MNKKWVNLIKVNTLPLHPYTLTSPSMVTQQPRSNQTPALENGDRLSRHEFERRYAASPDVKKAELIEGVVYVASPLRFQRHAEPHSNLVGLLWNYRIATPGVMLGIESTILLDQVDTLRPKSAELLVQ
ncbi:MAG: hypothetical protein ACRAVC_07230 [Trichormus sp.]